MAIGRRDLLTGRRARPAAGAGAGPAIRPRADWAGDLAPLGPLTAEEPRFLLVHHTVNSNDYGADSVPDLLRSIYRAHTAPEKGWPDVAYNFFIDRFGTIWEGRAGSIDGPVRGDATGGSQGFAQLCSFLGDHRTAPPSPEAQAAMISLLAHLARRDGIDLTPGATATFTSRGSNKHPQGTTVTTPTISAHRDMSATECPGDAAYALVTGRFRTEAAAQAATPTTTTTTTTSTTSTTTEPATTTTGSSTTTGAATSTTAPAPTAPPTPVTTSDGGAAGSWAPAALAATGVTAVVAGVIALRRRRI